MKQIAETDPEQHTHTCPRTRTHAHAHAHMPTHTHTCPRTRTHAHAHRKSISSLLVSRKIVSNCTVPHAPAYLVSYDRRTYPLHPIDSTVSLSFLSFRPALIHDVCSCLLRCTVCVRVCCDALCVYVFVAMHCVYVFVAMHCMCTCLLRCTVCVRVCCDALYVYVFVMHGVCPCLCDAIVCSHSVSQS